MISDTLFLENKDKPIENILRDCEDKYDKCCPSRDIKTIALSCEGLSDGGIERIVSILCEKFVDAGYRVIIFSTKKPSEKDYHYPKKVERIVIPDYDDVPQRLMALEQNIFANDIDVLIENYWASPFLIWEMMLCKEILIPFITYVHGNFSFIYGVNNEFSKIFHRVIRLSDVVVCLDRVSEKFFTTIGSKCCRIANPVAPELLNIKDSRKFEGKRILWLGRLVEGKRFEDALLIFEKVRKTIPDAEMEVVGWGKQGKRMLNLAKKMKMSKCVHFRGYQEEVLDYYKNNDVYLMTSESEGYPTCLVEAKAMGIPIVMYDLPYLSINEDGRGFCSAPIGDTDRMAELVIDVLTDKVMQKRLSDEGQLCFETICSKNIVEEWKTVFSLAFEKNRKIDDISEVVDILTNRYYRSFERYEEASKEIAIGRTCLKLPRWIRDKMK